MRSHSLPFLGARHIIGLSFTRWDTGRKSQCPYGNRMWLFVPLLPAASHMQEPTGATRATLEQERLGHKPPMGWPLYRDAGSLAPWSCLPVLTAWSYFIHQGGKTFPLCLRRCGLGLCQVLPNIILINRTSGPDGSKGNIHSWGGISLWINTIFLFSIGLKYLFSYPDVY